MEEMHRTHKEPVWGWVSAVAGLIAVVRQSRTAAAPRASRKATVRQVVTPWSPRSRPGWSA
ncbi:hypothetical protein BH09PSE1_BH09PSE1_21230 [soil metagenome]